MRHPDRGHGGVGDDPHQPDVPSHLRITVIGVRTCRPTPHRSSGWLAAGRPTVKVTPEAILSSVTALAAIFAEVTALSAMALVSTALSASSLLPTRVGGDLAGTDRVSGDLVGGHRVVLDRGGVHRWPGAGQVRSRTGASDVPVSVASRAVPTVPMDADRRVAGDVGGPYRHPRPLTGVGPVHGLVVVRPVVDDRPVGRGRDRGAGHRVDVEVGR